MHDLGQSHSGYDPDWKTIGVGYWEGQEAGSGTKMHRNIKTPKGTQYTDGLNFCAPDFNKLPNSLRLQGDKVVY